LVKVAGHSSRPRSGDVEFLHVGQAKIQSQCWTCESRVAAPTKREAISACWRECAIQPGCRVRQDCKYHAFDSHKAPPCHKPTSPHHAFLRSWKRGRSEVTFITSASLSSSFWTLRCSWKFRDADVDSQNKPLIRRQGAVLTESGKAKDETKGRDCNSRCVSFICKSRDWFLAGGHTRRL